MSVLLTALNLSHGFGATPLFQGVSFTISEQDRIGLIGPNGTGKSTLLKVLAGSIAPDHGQVAKRSKLRVAYLAQVPELVGKTVRDVVAARFATESEQDWEVDARTDEWVNKLDLDPDQDVASLSGGWKKRVALAQALATDPDLLLLDEPTNHLDVDSIVWLEKLLANARFATLTITHDRLFLQRVSNRILELDRRNPDGLFDVRGDYATYVERKAEAMAAQEKREVSLRNTLRRETEWLRQGAKARSTKQEARIQRAGDLAGEVQNLSALNRKASVALDFQGRDAAEGRPKRFLEAQGASKSFGTREVFRDVDIRVGPSTRLGLLGANGCGKSTLLRVLLGEEAPTSGEVFRRDGLRVAYFEQGRSSLDPKQTLAEAISPDGDHVIFRGVSMHRNGYLERFLFRAEQMVQPVSSLSGGEQSRLLLARLMLLPADVLVLDEPTNDLDLATLEVLEEALASFEGAVLLVTHDRYFLDQATTELIAFNTKAGEEGRVTHLFGLAQWETWSQGQSRSAKSKPLTAENPSAAPAPTKKRKLSFKEQRDWDTLEGRILEAEGRLAVLEQESASPEVATDHVRLSALGTQIQSVRREIETMYARWAELELLNA